MTQAVRMAAAELAEVLERENAALSRLDLQAVTALLDAKRAALEAFQSLSSQAAATADTAGAAGDKPMRKLALRLQDAVVENKRLLERAMVAQQHIMSLLAQTARQAAPTHLYGALGAYVGRTGGAFALSARA